MVPKRDSESLRSSSGAIQHNWIGRERRSTTRCRLDALTKATSGFPLLVSSDNTMTITAVADNLCHSTGGAVERFTEAPAAAPWLIPCRKCLFFFKEKAMSNCRENIKPRRFHSEWQQRQSSLFSFKIICSVKRATSNLQEKFITVTRAGNTGRRHES